MPHTCLYRLYRTPLPLTKGSATASEEKKTPGAAKRRAAAADDGVSAGPHTCINEQNMSKV
jgi:hypothetical protein